MFRSLLSSLPRRLPVASWTLGVGHTHFLWRYNSTPSHFTTEENQMAEQSKLRDKSVTNTYSRINALSESETELSLSTSSSSSSSSSSTFAAKQESVFSQEELQKLSADIVTEHAVNVSIARDLHGPWLVMTDDLQGELFIDHDGFVFYRPASGLGYGIGTMKLIASNAIGTAFTMELETYLYEQNSSFVPLFALQFSITGMVEKVSSASSTYTTFSLTGVWEKTNKNVALDLPNDAQISSVFPSTVTTTSTTTPIDVNDKKSSNNNDDTTCQEASSPPPEKMTGQFHCAKITPWNERTNASTQHWKPDANFMNVFKQVFPQVLQLNSHLKREQLGTERTTVHFESDSSENKSIHEMNVNEKVKHMDLTPYAVGDVPGVYYIPDYISVDEERQMLERIKSTPEELKQQLTKRTAQEWGCTMCAKCKQSFVSDANVPPWVQQFMDMLVYDGLYTPATFPNSVRIHEYHKGDGIGPHCDGPIYVPIVTVLSMASTTVMNFYPRREPYVHHPMDHYKDTFRFDDGEIGKECPLQSVVMEPRSLLVFSGIAYYYYPHGVSDKEVDILTPEKVGKVVNRHLLRDKDIMEINRQYRVSITTRNLLTRCTHEPARAEYNMKRAWYVYNHKPVPETLFTSPMSETISATCENDVSSANANCIPVEKKQQTGVSLGSLVDASLNGLDSKIEMLLTSQWHLAKELDELKTTIVQLEALKKEYHDNTSVVLNHLSSTLLELDSKVDELNEHIRSKK